MDTATTVEGDTGFKQPAQSESGEFYLDDEGKPLCMAFLRNNKCRYRKSCCWSHRVPDELKRTFAAKKAEEKKEAQAERELVQTASAAAAARKPLPSWLHLHREEVSSRQRTPGHSTYHSHTPWQAIFSYDASAYPLGEALAQVLQVPGGLDGLSQMHTQELPEAAALLTMLLLLTSGACAGATVVPQGHACIQVRRAQDAEAMA